MLLLSVKSVCGIIHLVREFSTTSVLLVKIEKTECPDPSLCIAERFLRLLVPAFVDAVYNIYNFESSHSLLYSVDK